MSWTTERARPPLRWPSPGRSTRAGLRRLAFAVFILMVSIVLVACRVNQIDLPTADKLDPDEELPTAPAVSDVPYGPLPQHRFDIWRPTEGTSQGTIVYFHSGGWNKSGKQFVSDIVRNQLTRGWTVVSVDYRLSTNTIGAWGRAGDVRATQILADVDRAIRHLKANSEWLDRLARGDFRIDSDPVAQ